MNNIILKLVGAQLAVLIISSVVLILVEQRIGVSYLLACISIVIPTLFLALNIVISKLSTIFFWVGVLFNKVLMLMLIWFSIKILEEPSFGAFLVGIIVMTHVPIIYVLCGNLIEQLDKRLK